MENQITIPITNGVGSKEIINGTYTVTSLTTGFNDTSITPAEQEITEEVNTYNFTISASGTLTLHVSDDGTDIGVPIVGAKFVRCDSNGTTYGEEIISNEEGNAVFATVPFAEENAPLIYYKQTSSDSSHTFNEELQNTSMASETSTIEVQNEEAALRTINLTDTNYEGLPISDGQVILNVNV